MITSVSHSHILLRFLALELRIFIKVKKEKNWSFFHMCRLRMCIAYWPEGLLIANMQIFLQIQIYIFISIKNIPSLLLKPISAD
jgi:hypothetical protein